MSVAYSTLTANASSSQYPVTVTPEWSSEYPTDSTTSVFGPIYLPKVYGRDLSAFEIASSGKIAVTLQDVYSFDLSRDTNTNTVSMVTADSGDNLFFASSNASIELNAAGSNIDIAAGSNVQMAAGAGGEATILLDASNVGGSNIQLASSSNIYVEATNDFVLEADRFIFGNMVITSDQASFTDTNAFIGNSNAFVKIVDSNIEYFAKGDMEFTTSNNTSYTNLGDFDLSTSNLSISTDSATTLSTDTLAISSSSNASISSAGTISMESSNAMTMSTDATMALTGTQGVTIDSAAANTNMQGSILDIAYTSNVSLSALATSLASTTTTTVEAGDSLLTKTSGEEARILYDAASDSNLQLYSSSNMYAQAGNDFVLDAQRFVFGSNIITSDSTTIVGDLIDIGNSNAYLKIDDSNIDYYALGNMHFMTSNNTLYENALDFTLNTQTLNIGASSNIQVSSDASLIASAEDASVTTVGALSVDAGSSAAISAATTLSLSGANSATLTSAQDTTINGDALVTVSAPVTYVINAGNEVETLSGNKTSDVTGSVTESAASKSTSIDAASTLTAGTIASTSATTTTVSTGTDFILSATSNVTFDAIDLTETLSGAKASVVTGAITESGASLTSTIAGAAVLSADTVDSTSVAATTVSAGTDFILSATSNVTFDAIDLTETLSGAKASVVTGAITESGASLTSTIAGAAVLSADTVDSTSVAATTVSAGTDFILSATSNVTIDAIDLTETLSGAKASVVTGAITESGASLTSTIAGSAALSADTVASTSATSTAVTAGTTLAMQGASASLVSTTTDVAVDAATSVDIVAGTDMTVGAVNLTETLSGSKTVSATADITETAASRSATISGTSTLSADSIAWNSTNSSTLTAGTNAVISATGTIDMDANIVDVASLSQTVHSAGTTFSIAAGGNIALDTDASTRIKSDIATTLNGGIISGDAYHTTMVMDNLKTSFLVDATERMKVTNEGVTVIGKLEVDGEIQSINTYAESLYVVNKEVVLSPGADDGVYDDGLMTNDKSGVVIAGKPGGKTEVDMWEKSLRWNHGSTGMTSLMATGPEDPNADAVTAFGAESFWELKGGDFRLSLMKSDVDRVTFGFRIGYNGELELMKQYSTDGGASFITKVVSRFGRTMTV